VAEVEVVWRCLESGVSGDGGGMEIFAPALVGGSLWLAVPRNVPIDERVQRNSRVYMPHMFTHELFTPSYRHSGSPAGPHANVTRR
jgi:hypothetical protein